MIKLNEFTEHDWDGFAGAEEDGDLLPLTSGDFTVDGVGAFAVIDKDGINIYIPAEDLDQERCMIKFICGIEKSRKFFENFISPKMTMELLEMLGFDSAY